MAQEMSLTSQEVPSHLTKNVPHLAKNVTVP